MDRSFDGHGLSRAQLQAKAEAAEHAGQVDGGSSHDQAASIENRTPNPDDTCDWRGDAPEPEHDDLADACNTNQQPPHPDDVCDWQGDSPENQDDEFGSICPPNNQSRLPGQGVEAAEVDALPRVTSIPKIVLPPADDSSGFPAEDEKKVKRKKLHNREAARTSTVPPTKPGAASESPPAGKTHSPWVDSLDQMLPVSMQENVNKRIKQTLDAVTSLLAPSPQDQSSAPESTAADKKTERTASLAPEPATFAPSDFYTPMSVQVLPGQPISGQPVPGQPSAHNKPVADKKEEKDRKRADKKAKQEAKQRARHEKKEKRKEHKERHRKEKERKKKGKHGEELPVQLRQGLRDNLGTGVPPHPKCDICIRSADSALSSSKLNPRCTICAKAAEKEATKNYLKSSTINFDDLPSLGDLIDIVKKLLPGKVGASASRPAGSGQAEADEELVQHIAQHVHDYAASGGGTDLREHVCNEQAHHGLDGNRDSPAPGLGEMICTPKNLDLSGISTPAEVDWWVQALSSNSACSPYRVRSPFFAPPPPRRSKSTVYEPRHFHHSGSLGSLGYDLSRAAYHVYLPFAVCHSAPCNPTQFGRIHHWPIHPFPQGPGSNFEVPVPMPGRTETIPSDTPRQSHDGRYRSGSL
ncbi:hypothetical protein F5Y19DRAFT_476567 [Xylariaceae sp. FL1651]|nr:hypothetical protein F5Y19DRAFT_476567 [Xylariaceae sp. FL1651]